MSTLVSVSSRTDAISDSAALEFAAEVRSGLCRPGQKELHSKYLYDELGSALFEAITYLPEYGLTRADERLLRRHAGAMADRIGEHVRVAELGSGTGRKTRFLLEALREKQENIQYYPIDVSPTALARCRRELKDVADVHPLAESYIPGMLRATSSRSPGERICVLFLGSTIGNFERKCALAFLADLRRCLEPGDRLLIGADLVKPAGQLILAYDDPTGVTAAFNLNLLGRVNRELRAGFALRNFEHEARYIESQRRIEMHLRSRIDQTVVIRDAGCEVRFRQGETIWTESSHKYQLEELPAIASQTGFREDAHWVDQEWPFIESLWVAA